MTIFSAFKRSSLYSEYQGNPRLQWMIVVVLAIILLSLSKSLLDPLDQTRSDALQQIQLLERLKTVEASDIDESKTDTLLKAYEDITSQIPSATSSSTAEARALSDIENTIGRLIKRKRLNLVGAQDVTFMQQRAWSIRIDVAGQIEANQLPDLLRQFDSSNLNRRIASLQYSPKASGNINMVVDVLFIGEGNE